jgi:hypothetical protein
MKRFWTTIALLLLALPVIAQQNYPRDLTLTYDQPTHYTDGTVIEAGELVSNRFNCARQDGTVVVDESRPVTVAPGSTQSEVFGGVIPQPGTYTCYAYASTVDAESDASNAAFKKFTGKPLPPSNTQAAMRVFTVTFT